MGQFDLSSFGIFICLPHSSALLESLDPPVVISIGNVIDFPVCLNCKERREKPINYIIPCKWSFVTFIIFTRCLDVLHYSLAAESGAGNAIN